MSGKSASTSTSRRTAPRPARSVTEAQYLDAQAKQAQAAMRAKIGDVQSALTHGLSPIRWAHDHPWLAIITSVAGGFAVASALVPSREQQTLARLRRVQEALHPAPKLSEEEKQSKKPDPKESPLGILLLRQLIGLIRPVIVSLLSSAISARTRPPEPPAPTTAPPVSDNLGPVPPL